MISTKYMSMSEACKRKVTSNSRINAHIVNIAKGFQDMRFMQKNRAHL